MNKRTITAERLYRLEFDNKPQIVEVIEADYENIGSALLRILEGESELILMELDLLDMRALIDMLEAAYISQGGGK